MANVKTGTITFTTPSALALWKHEILGQLSDGYWENKSPATHWQFWQRLDAELGSQDRTICSDWQRPITSRYNLNGLRQYVEDRMVKLGRMGRAGAMEGINDQCAYVLRMAAEYMPATFEEWQTLVGSPKDPNVQDYQREYLRKVPEWAARKFYVTSYTVKDLVADLRRIKRAMKDVA